MDLDLLSDLTASWVLGWGVSRTVRCERDGAVWHVRVEAASRLLEHVTANATLARIEGITQDPDARPDTWLTIVGGTIPSVAQALRGLERVTRHESMMTVELGDEATAVGPDSPSANQVDLRIEGDVAFATVTLDGALAASGQASVRAGDAVFDRIRTQPEFQRRGLGRAIMAGLAEWAVSRGARRGILVASIEGQRLYASLGWRAVAPVDTFALAAG